MIRHLVIEYHLNGSQPGYRYRPPVDDFDEQTLKSIWRQAMPRGQGWSADAYQAATSLKCFPVDRKTMAISRVEVTGQQDEVGRSGIRRADITVLPQQTLFSTLEQMQKSYPAAVQQAAQKKMSAYLWRRLLNKIVPRLKDGKQAVLAYPYAGPESWQVIELLVMRIVTAPGVRLLEGWGSAPSFTTLALDWREESRIVALPLDRVKSAPAIRIP